MARKTKLDISTAASYNIRQQINGLFREAKSYGYSHAKILEKYGKIVDRLPKGTPSWVRRDAHIHSAALFEGLYNHDVKWQLYLHGKKVESKDVATGEWNKVRGRHEWRDSGKLFYEGQYRD